MGPYLSWALLIALVAVLGRYYTKDRFGVSKNKGLADRQAAAESSSKKTKRRQKRAAGGPPSTDRVSTATSNGTASATTTTAATSASEADVDESDIEPEKGGDDMSNRDFAHQLYMARKGTDLAAKTKDSKKDNKFVKPKSAEQQKPIRDIPEAESAVSDMLEAPAPGPSVIRITGSMEEKPSNKKDRKAPRPVETKEQAQRRIKQERNRELVQQAEQERRKLMEKQLHTARELERIEQAKKVPAAKAWESSDATIGRQPQQQVSTNGLLDTFEPSHKLSNEQSTINVPSKPEQIGNSPQSEQSEEWTTVGGKKDRKKVAKADSAMSETSVSDLSTVPSSQPAFEQPPKAVSKDSGNRPVKSQPPRFSYLPGEHGYHPLDSDWVA